MDDDKYADSKCDSCEKMKSQNCEAGLNKENAFIYFCNQYKAKEADIDFDESIG